MQLTRFKKVLFIAFFAAIALAVMSNATETSATTTEGTKTTEKSIDLTTAAATTVSTIPDENETPDEEAAQHDGTISRVKRQWGCPSNCYGSCSSNVQCRRYNVRSVCVQGCCCGSSTNISTACSGMPAVAACLNNLCGQGYFCSTSNYCCRCQSGAESGPCVNGLCPAGFACNTNDYCCPIGSSAVLDVCVNGLCPTGYTCGAGNLCYQTTTTG
uniref:Uncharacterized protein n=2 Tax=Panagrolaimus TaxID=55784 RepID=A0A914P286_9BILA